MSESRDLLKRNFRRFLLLVVLVAVTYLVVRNIGVSGNMLKAVIGLGAVVFIHEFGHFIFAKLCGIKVEVFSIFMPPTLLGMRKTEDGLRFRILPKFFPKENDERGDGWLSFSIGKGSKRGETEYCIGLIPFGGFVKMLGQEDVGSIEVNDDPRSYANKPVGTRLVVIAAGVVLNAISAILIFMTVFLIGINLTPPVVGGVVPDSSAARVGLKPGDEIIEIAGESYNLDFSSIAVAAVLSGKDEEVKVKVKHRDGSIEDFVMVAKQMPGRPTRVFGIAQPQSLTIAKLSKADANDLCARTGLIAGDRIKSVNGKDVQSHWELSRIVQDAFVPAVTVLAERTDPVSKVVKLVKSQIRLSLSPTRKEANSAPTLGDIYSMVPRLRITDVSGVRYVNDTEPSLQSGDIILAIGNVENPIYEEMGEVTTEYEDRELPMKVLRTDADGVEEILTVSVVPKWSKESKRVVIGIGVVFDIERAVVAKTVTGKGGSAALAIPRGSSITAVDGANVSNFYDVAREIGRYVGKHITIYYRLDEEIAGDVVLDVGGTEEFVPIKSTFAGYIPFKPLERVYKAGGPIDAIMMGYRKTVMFIAQTYATLKSLISRSVGMENLMGPVGIVTISYQVAAKRPFVYQLYLLGLISACIAVLNFLPLLPFDGGHIVFLLIEKVKGSPVNERVQGVILQAGWVLVGVLILYVTFNDILRIFKMLSL